MTTKKATAKPAATTKPETAATTTRSKYYKGLDIFFYIMYCIFIIVILYSVYKFFIDKDVSDEDREFYKGLMVILLKVTSVLTLLLTVLAFTTKYNVMYTLLHLEPTKKSKEKFGTYKQVSFQM